MFRRPICCRLFVLCVFLQTFDQLAAMTNEMTAEITVAEYQQNVSELWNALMELEMQLVEQLEVTS